MALVLYREDRLFFSESAEVLTGLPCPALRRHRSDQEGSALVYCTSGDCTALHCCAFVSVSQDCMPV